MKDKFFVPYETAKALKEKGYNEEHKDWYDSEGNLWSNDYNDITNSELAEIHYSAPTYHEVLDWLESKGVLIDCTCGYDYDTKKEWYRCFVITRQRRFEDAFISNFASTREEALNAAILKALELI